MAKYITLTTTSGSSFNFRVAYPGRKRTLEKSSTIKKTLGGRPSINEGGIYEVHNYMIMLLEEEVESGYGNKDDLETLFRITNPNPSVGDPSSKLTFVDHYGTTKYAYLVGKFDEQAVGVSIEGPNAWFFINVQLQVVNS